MTPYHEATAIKDPEHLKRWLSETGRNFVIFKSSDLVDALPWPDGVDTFMQVVEAYRQHRITIPTEHAPCPRLAAHRTGDVCPYCKNSGAVVAKSKDDKLDLMELKAATVWLINQVLEQEPTWNPFP